MLNEPMARLCFRSRNNSKYLNQLYKAIGWQAHSLTSLSRAAPLNLNRLSIASAISYLKVVKIGFKYCLFVSNRPKRFWINRLVAVLQNDVLAEATAALVLLLLTIGDQFLYQALQLLSDH